MKEETRAGFWSDCRQQDKCADTETQIAALISYLHEKLRQVRVMRLRPFHTIYRMLLSLEFYYLHATFSHHHHHPESSPPRTSPLYDVHVDDNADVHAVDNADAGVVDDVNCSW